MKTYFNRKTEFFKYISIKTNAYEYYSPVESVLQDAGSALNVC